MKKLLALLLCAALLLPMAAMADDDGRIHITYSFWGNQNEAEGVQVALDAFNAMQDKIFVEPMQIPNEEYTQTLVNYTIAGQLPDCGMVNENSVLYFARNGVMADVSKMYEGEELQPMDCITFKDPGVHYRPRHQVRHDCRRAAQIHRAVERPAPAGDLHHPPGELHPGAGPEHL